MAKPQLDLFGSREIVGDDLSSRFHRKRDREERRRKPDRVPPASLDQQYADFASKNPHVMTELLRLARARIDRGETYISIKALWEELRVSMQRRDLAYDDDLKTEHKLNNNYTAYYARALIRAEPRLDGVIKLRERKK